MGIKKWRSLKGIFYVLLMGIVTVVGLRESQILIPVVYILAAGLIFGMELKELAIAHKLCVTFKPISGVGDCDDPRE